MKLQVNTWEPGEGHVITGSQGGPERGQVNTGDLGRGRSTQVDTRHGEVNTGPGDMGWDRLSRVG